MRSIRCPSRWASQATERGREALADTWSELNQCEIIRPPLMIRIYMGLWFALLQTAIDRGSGAVAGKGRNRRGWVFAAIYTSARRPGVLLGYFASPPWQLLGTNHVLHHIWLWFSFGVKASAWFLFAIGLGALICRPFGHVVANTLRLPKWI